MSQHVYPLCDPDTADIRWVGVTVNPSRRLSRHLEADGSSPDKDAWIVSLLSHDTIPVMEVVYITDSEDEAVEVETTLIAHFRSTGVSLFNRADGGQGTTGCIHSDEIRKYMRDAQPQQTPEHLERLSLAIRAAMTPAVREKMSKAISASMTPARRLQNSVAHAKVWTPTKRDEHSAIMIDSWKDPERREAAAEFKRNWWTDERRAEMSQKLRDAWTRRRAPQETT